MQDTMQAPRFKWEWNINTITNLIGLITTFVLIGIAYSNLQNADQRNAEKIDALENRMAGVEAEVRKIDRHEIRLSSVEQQAVTSAEAMKAVEQTLSNLSADIRVVREILQRLEAKERSK